MNESGVFSGRQQRVCAAGFMTILGGDQVRRGVPAFKQVLGISRGVASLGKAPSGAV